MRQSRADAIAHHCSSPNSSPCFSVPVSPFLLCTRATIVLRVYSRQTRNAKHTRARHRFSQRISAYSRSRGPTSARCSSFPLSSLRVIGSPSPLHKPASESKAKRVDSTAVQVVGQCMGKGRKGLSTQQRALRTLLLCFSPSGSGLNPGRGARVPHYRGSGEEGVDFMPPSLSFHCACVAFSLCTAFAAV